MRGLVLAAAMLFATSASGTRATTAGEASGPAGELAISLSRDVLAMRPILVVTITNHSERPICIRKEMLENPNSEEIGLMVRNARARTVSLRWREGFIIPSIAGLVRVAPGDTARGQYYLDWRLRLREGGRFPRGMTARVSYEYDHCGDSAPMRSTSAWQPL